MFERDDLQPVPISAVPVRGPLIVALAHHLSVDGDLVGQVEGLAHVQPVVGNVHRGSAEPVPPFARLFAGGHLPPVAVRSRNVPLLEGPFGNEPSDDVDRPQLRNRLVLARARQREVLRVQKNPLVVPELQGYLHQAGVGANVEPAERSEVHSIPATAVRNRTVLIALAHHLSVDGNMVGHV